MSTSRSSASCARICSGPHGVPRVWLDEAEIDIGDSLIAKIDEGMKLSRYIAVVLSKKSIDAPWVKKEASTSQ